jgi:hypothetical protein
MTRTRALWRASLRVTLTLCASCADDALDEVDLHGSHAALVGGTRITTEQTPYVSVNGTCSGALLRNEWVLTANRCISNAQEGQPSTVLVFDPVNASNRARVLHVFRSPQTGVALLQLEGDMGVNGSYEGHLLQLQTGEPSSSVGDLRCRGVGVSTCSDTPSSDGILREGLNTISATTMDSLTVSGANTPTPGDVGGACTIGSGTAERIVGVVTSITSGCASATLTSASAVRAWAAAVMAHEQFGSALATGDSDNDGRDEVYVAAPGYGLERAGIVDVYESGPGGDTLVFVKRLDQAGLDINQRGDRFGAALAVADFNLDGFDDLAVGAPGEVIGAGASSVRAGAVYVFRGSSTGLRPWRRIDQQSPWLDTNHSGDGFGSSLAVGSFDADTGAPDLAVGAPLESNGTDSQSERMGAVYLYGGRPGAGAFDAPFTAFTRVLNTLATPFRDRARFGGALAAGDFDGDGRDDIAIGALGLASGFFQRSGLVAVFQPRAGTLFTLDQSGLDANEAGDLFGYSLLAADLNRDGRSELLVGAPGESLSAGAAPGPVISLPRSGRVYVYRGASPQLLPLQSMRAAGTSAEIASAFFGAELGLADLDQDGATDILVAATHQLTRPIFGSRTGRVFAHEWDDASSRLVSRYGIGPTESRGTRFGAAMVETYLAGALAVRPRLIVGVPTDGAVGRIDAYDAAGTLVHRVTR